MSTTDFASSSSLEPLLETASPQNALSIIPKPSISYRDYIIEDTVHSTFSSQVLFVHSEDSNECIVIKQLKPYQDTRYFMKYLEQRQKCQLEALRQNKLFTEKVYIGLARLYHTNSQQIRIGEILENPKEEHLEKAEYVLLMQKLPEDRRLDYLLENRENSDLLNYSFLLAEYAANMHNKLSPIKGNTYWGSYNQLQDKLEQNLELIDFLVKDNSKQLFQDYILFSKLTILKKSVKKFATSKRLKKNLVQRLTEEQIKHCHGDIKSPHIWIIPNNDNYDKQIIKVIDAIDFNPLFNHIDILSDFALLVVDIQARTKSRSLIDELINRYLELTNQDNDDARLVLDYYMLEKAIVCTIISILYDDLPQLGLRFLEIAEEIAEKSLKHH